MGPEFRRPPSPTPSHPNHHDQGRSKNNATTPQDALEYLRKVKKVFEKTPESYAIFLEIMKDFKTTKIGVNEVKDKVANLFYGHDDLLQGFNVFLPEEHGIVMPVHKPAPPPEVPRFHIEETVNFLNLIKARFANEPSVFSSFLEILHLYRTNHKSCEEVFQEVQPLFKDHPDLLSGFMRFLPMNNNIPDNKLPNLDPLDMMTFISLIRSLNLSR